MRRGWPGAVGVSVAARPGRAGIVTVASAGGRPGTSARTVTVSPGRNGVVPTNAPHSYDSPTNVDSPVSGLYVNAPWPKHVSDRRTRRSDVPARTSVTVASVAVATCRLGAPANGSALRETRTTASESVYGPRNGFRLPATFRADIGATLYFRRGPRPHALALNVYNATDRKNPFVTAVRETYDRDTGTRSRRLVGIALFPVLPTLSYQFSF